MSAPDDEDDGFYDFYSNEDDFCDCTEYDVDILEGRALCYNCGRSWWLTNEQLSREIEWQCSMIECAEAEDDQP